MNQPYPENVDGDFYVEEGCCTMCEVPTQEAPALFTYAFGDDGKPDHCFVSRQPKSLVELDDMLNAIHCAELGCIRYRGTDVNLLQRLINLGESDVCDAIDKEQPGPWWRFW